MLWRDGLQGESGCPAPPHAALGLRSCRLRVPVVTPSPRTSVLRDPHGFSPSPLPPSFFHPLIRFASPRTAPHSLTVNERAWPEASVTICMRNPPLPASRAPAPASRPGAASTPLSARRGELPNGSGDGANSERKGRGSRAQRAVHRPAGHLTRGGGRAETCLAPIIPSLSFNIYFFLNQKHSNSWG